MDGKKDKEKKEEVIIKSEMCKYPLSTRED